MGRPDEQREGSLPVVDELSEILGYGFHDESAASEAWKAQAQAEEEARREEERYIYEEEAATYEEEQRLTAQALADGRGY